MADKTEDKGDKTEDKGDKTEDKGFGGLLGPANGLSSGGWVVVSFIGPAGFDVRRLAAAVLFGGAGGKNDVGNAAAAALNESRKRAEDNRKLAGVVQKVNAEQRAALRAKAAAAPKTGRGAGRSRPKS